MVKVKLCGFSNKETVDLAASLDVDFLGFIFCETSPRNISPEKAKEITEGLPANVKKVAVIVDADNDKIAHIAENLKPDYLQLHGKESPERVLEIKNLFHIPIIKAVAISNKNDLLKVKGYENIVDFFLFDTKVGNSSGGSGKIFDWEILQNLKISKNWFLSGGLNIDNIDFALKSTKAKMIDLSSGIEKTKGVKSRSMIKNMMNFLK